MDNAEFAKHLAGIFENEIKQLLDKDLFERLEYAEQRCRERGHLFYFNVPDEKLRESKNDFDRLGLFLRAFRNDLEAEYNKLETDEERREMLAKFDEYFRTEIKRTAQNSLFYCAEFLLFHHFLKPPTLMKRAWDIQPEDYAAAGLERAGDRRRVLLKTFEPCFEEQIKHGGDRRDVWNETSRLWFLSFYNRFQIVIKNARRDFDRAKKRKGAKARREKEILAEITQHYKIPEEYAKTLNARQTPGELALNWAKKIMDVTGNDDYLRGEILRDARNDAKKHSRRDNYDLVGVNFGLAMINHTVTYSPDAKDDLKFPRPLLNEFDLKYDTYFMFVAKS